MRRRALHFRYWTAILSTNFTDRLTEVRSQLMKSWLVWGLLPLAASIVLTLLVNALMSGEATMTLMTLERRFQFILALGAGLFLIAFSLDSNWTNVQKLAKRIDSAAGLDAPGPGGKPKKRPDGRSLELLLIPHAGLVFDSILASVQALTLAGAGIAICAILAAAARLGLGYSLMLLILAASYQAFVLSRHTYYREVMETAAEGKLVYVPEEAQKK